MKIYKRKTYLNVLSTDYLNKQIRATVNQKKTFDETKYILLMKRYSSNFCMIESYSQ